MTVNKQHEATPSIFGSEVRTDTSPSKHGESAYEFLRRVAGPVWDQCRGLIQSWLEHYPEDGRSALATRLKTSDREFTTAFWELYLHELYWREGWSIEIEPAVAASSKRPDFLVSKEGVSYYIEARCTFEGNNDGGAAARLKTVYDSINTVDSGAFLLSVTVVSVGRYAPALGRLRAGLESWLSTLDPDTTQDHDDPAYQYDWKKDDWHMQFRPIPRRKEVRDSPPRRAIGIYSPHSASFVDDITPLRDAIRKKGSRYGVLPFPLVLAINVGGGFHDDEDTTQALYGTVGWRIDTNDPSAEPTPVITTRGYWGSSAKPEHTGVAGALIATGIHYSRVAKYVPTFWRHPFADQQVPALAVWRVARATGEGIQFDEPSASIDRHFGLPPNWPVGEPFPRP